MHATVAGGEDGESISMRSVVSTTILAVVAAVPVDIIPTGYDASLAPSQAVAPSAAGCPPPTEVAAQLFVNKLHTVNEMVETIKLEAFFRLEWHDPRLARTLSSGCAENRSYADTKGIWVPDFYFPNAVENNIAEPYDGELVTISPDGHVLWSSRARLVFDCAMDFWKMPWDSQSCPIALAMYRSTVEHVVVAWQRESLVYGAWTTKPVSPSPTTPRCTLAPNTFIAVTSSFANWLRTNRSLCPMCTRPRTAPTSSRSPSRRQNSSPSAIRS